MANRTNESAVAANLGSHYDKVTSPALTAFIDRAHVMVNAVRACATTKGITLGADLLTQLEILLACHYFSRADQMFQSKNTGKAGATFQGQTGMGLDASGYGQDAKELDYSGCLNALSKGNRAGMFWAGKTEPEQLTYEERN